jgi:hypothetical protein
MKCTAALYFKRQYYCYCITMRAEFQHTPVQNLAHKNVWRSLQYVLINICANWEYVLINTCANAIAGELILRTEYPLFDQAL